MTTVDQLRLVGRRGRDHLQELRELGLRGVLFRLRWESQTWLQSRIDSAPLATVSPSAPATAEALLRRLPFADPSTVADAMRQRIGPEAHANLLQSAQAARRGQIVGFGHLPLDFGNPIDWNRNPINGQRWSSRVHWARALEEGAGVGDVKLSWEIGRFPHAYAMARAAAFAPEHAPRLATALLQQIDDFHGRNPPGIGIHWHSGQEITIRHMAWAFALDVLLSRQPLAQQAAESIAAGIHAGALHTEAVIEYATQAVYNNHALADALGLYMAGVLLPGAPEAECWRRRGRDVLDEQVQRQFYADGAYIQLSHNYHRVALSLLTWGAIFARAAGEPVGDRWLRAMDRSLNFLVAHQNPSDGTLPNFGANDGSRPSLLSTCKFGDFRSTLQAVAMLVRGERLYEPGPWDERGAWLLGTPCLDLPLRPPTRRSSAFSATGFFVLRAANPSSFATLRCGSIADRFGQIDMLHADLWWRGHNVAVDAGSYLYNGPPEWHAHFVGTASHNTVTVDGRDQMLQFRKFKFLYWTRARSLQHADDGAVKLCAGEHYGYARHRGGVVHRRAMALVGDALFVIVDRLIGKGKHRARLHWLFGDFPHSSDGRSFSLSTPSGEFGAAVFDVRGIRLDLNVVRGQESPPRGWLSRHYAGKVAVPSLAVEHDGALPHTWITVMGPGRVDLRTIGTGYEAHCDGGRFAFHLDDGLIVPNVTEPELPSESEP